MGTPDFAVASLDLLVKNKFNIVGVVTAPDKPAGRGQQLSQSAVKIYALKHQLNLLQPDNLKADDFIAELAALEADLQLVVAFRMLPEKVWNMPPEGTYNLHASLLPKYPDPTTSLVFAFTTPTTRYPPSLVGRIFRAASRLLLP